MEESEKMMALKKAYAEIILNTAKEAAARVMVSERKTQLHRHDLSTTKDEALRLLLRLKQTMDFKINEVEMKSQDQQRKIEVLEAQLQEAEDIVSSLRAELDDTHMKLYKLSKNQMCNRSNAMDKAHNESEISQPVNISYEAVLASEADRINNGAYGHSTANNYVEESSHSDELEIPSIISRRKEPELYLKGCAQRLRTCDGNLLKGQLQNMKAPGADKDGEKVCVKTSTISDFSCVEEKEPVDSKEVEEEDPRNIMQVLKSLRKMNKRGSGYKRNSVSPLKCVSCMATGECSDLSTPQGHLPDFHDLHESDNNDKGTDSNSPSTAPSAVFEKGTLPEHVFRFQNDDKLIEAVNEDREATIQQSVSGGSLDALGSNTELEMKKMAALKLDVKLLETSDGLSSPPSKDKVLKYTFQRKRKRDSVVGDENSLLQEENPVRGKMAKKQNGNLEPVKSGDVTASLRDGRRTEQVARQLVSMSDKKWIK